MKILFFINTLDAGGKERRLTELMKHLKMQQEIEFELVVMNEKIHYIEVYDLGINIHYIIRKSRRDFTVFPKFFKICKSYRPDIIHCWDSMTAVYATIIGKLLYIKVINGMVVNTPVKQNLFNKHWLRARLTFPLSDIIVGNSYAGLKAFKAPRKKSICIYNGIDSLRFNGLKAKTLVKEELIKDTSINIFIIGMVASFGKNKDYETLIQTAHEIIKERDNIRFILVGDGENFQKIKSSVPNHLLNRILFLGKRSDVESIVNIFDIGILLTNTKVHGEGISNSILEYMALGKPVIATRGGGTNEVVFDYKNGFLINYGDKDQLKDRIYTIINDRDLKNKLGEGGEQIIKEKFDIEINTKKYISLYHELANKNF